MVRTADPTSTIQTCNFGRTALRIKDEQVWRMGTWSAQRTLQALSVMDTVWQHEIIQKNGDLITGLHFDLQDGFNYRLERINRENFHATVLGPA